MMDGSPPHEPPGFVLDANRGPAFIYLCSTMMILSAIAVGLRFLSQKVSKTPYIFSDWFTLTALPIAWLPSLLMIYCVKSYGFGKHVAQTSTKDNHEFWHFFYVAEIIYPISIAMTKMSVLLFYWRILRPASLRMASVVTGIMTTAWAFATMLTAALSCSPINAFWDNSMPHSCINTTHYYIGQVVPNVAIYLALLLFPLTLLRTLQLSVSQRIALASIFSLGLFVMITPALRLHSIIVNQRSADFTYDLVDRQIWTALETNLALLCSSLPSMDPLLQIILLGSAKSAIEPPKSPQVLRSPRSGNSHISSTRTTWHDRARSPEIENRGYGCMCVSGPDSKRPWSCSAVSAHSRKAPDSPCASEFGVEEMTLRKYGSRTLSHTSIAEDESIAESGTELRPASRVASRAASRTASRTASRAASVTLSRTPSRTPSSPVSRPASRQTSRPTSRQTSRTACRTASRPGSKTSRSSRMKLSRIVRQ